MLLKALHPSAHTWKKIFDALKWINEDVNFQWTKDGLFIQAMDSSHVSLICLELWEEGFKEYRCTSPIKIGISIDSLSKILNCSGSEDSILFECEDDGKLHISFSDPKNLTAKHFELLCLELAGEDFEIPESVYPISVCMNSSSFKSICRDLTIMGDDIKIQAVDDETIIFSTKGAIGNGEIKIKASEEHHIECSAFTTIELALRYLNFFTKATTLSQKVEIKIGDNLPFVAKYEIKTQKDSTWGNLVYYLAPKLQEEEEEEY